MIASSVKKKVCSLSRKVSKLILLNNHVIQTWPPFKLSTTYVDDNQKLLLLTLSTNCQLAKLFQQDWLLSPRVVRNYANMHIWVMFLREHKEFIQFRFLTPRQLDFNQKGNLQLRSATVKCFNKSSARRYFLTLSPKPSTVNFLIIASSSRIEQRELLKPWKQRSDPGITFLKHAITLPLLDKKRTFSSQNFLMRIRVKSCN